MDDTTLARVNLCAVLRTLQHLPPLDPETQQIAAGVHETIQFTSRAATVRLAINDGVITHHMGAGPNTINLVFPTAKAVNKMFAGTGNPIPTKGFRKIKFLTGPFTQITGRLQHYLVPTPESLAQGSFADKNAELSLYIAAYALGEIGNYDPKGKLSASRIPNGDIQLAVRNGPAIVINATGGKLRVRDGVAENRRAKMVFADIGTAGAVLRGELASYTAIGRDLIELGGYVPMLDNMNKLLALVPLYLGQE